MSALSEEPYAVKEPQRPSGRRQTFWIAFALFLAGFVLCWLRAPDSLVNPIVYTEDALWIGQALETGWLQTFISAKPGYLVWGNLILLWLSSQASVLACGDPLVCLPETVSFVSYGFFSGLATLLFFAAPAGAGVTLRIAWFLSVFLLPLGESSYEVFGRISNIGFYAVALTLALLLLRERTGWLIGLMLDVALLVCVATNPATVIIILAGLCLRYWTGKGRADFWRSVRRDSFLAIGVALLSIWIVLLMSAVGGTRVGEFHADKLVEVVFARFVLYPFVFPFYGQLTDATTLALVSLLFVILLTLSFSVRTRAQVSALLLAASAFLCFWCISIFLRPSLTQQLGDYSTTFPDRYFAGANLCLMLLFLFVLNAGWKKGSWFRGGSALASTLLAVLYASHLPTIFEITSTQPKQIVTFRQQLCFSGSPQMVAREGDLITVPIASLDRQMALPVHRYSDARRKVDCRQEFRQHFYFNDVNWENGFIRTKQSRFLLPYVAEFVGDYRPGKTVRFPDGEERVIVSVHQAGQYLDVSTDGGPIDAGNWSPLDVVALHPPD